MSGRPECGAGEDSRQPEDEELAHAPSVLPQVPESTEIGRAEW